jgi:toxin HigB-1
VQLSFATKHLRAICESKSVASRHLDADASRNLRARLADIRATENVTELCSGSPREMPKVPSTWMVDISASQVLAFEPGQLDVPKLKSGLVDWSKVTRVKVIHIGALTNV